ncbi:vesicle-associated protein 3-1-like [Triticum aestivum]|nr:vesicle-associated protein 3-1-like [Triticum aestivum]
MCLSDCPKRRPYIWDIVTMLNNIENTKEQINDCDDSPVAPISPYPWELLELDMLELNFPFEINKQIPCSLQLTNVSNDYVAFDIVMTGVLLYDVEPKKGIVPPQSKCNVMVTLQAQQKAPNSTAFKDEFFMRCAAVNEGIMREDITQDMLDKKSAKGVDEVTLKVVISAVGSA